MHTTTATDTTLPTAAAKVRIQALDLIRGMAILGILAVNVDGFAAPTAASLNPRNWVFPNEGWTALSYWLMDTLFHVKFVAVFSMLFGVSLFLVGGERGDRARGRLLARRLGILFGFGLLHGFAIWWGDILSLYAMAGAILFFCRSWSARTLFIAGITLFLAMALYHQPPRATPPPQPDPAAVAKRQAAIAATIAEATSSWQGAAAVNARQYTRLLTNYPMAIPSTLGLMMIGLSLFKSGFLQGRSERGRYLAVLAAGAAALVPIGWLCWQRDIAMTSVASDKLVLDLLAPLVGLAYASGLILLLRRGAGRVLAPLAAAGRMAFTNYLTQSIIMTSIFYGGRGALMGQVDRPVLWLLVALVWLLQLAWSPLWLSRFEMGPFEWVWRCLTVGYRVPLHKR
ncbi:DUF418 domain-containing protein [Massilia sp. G4R7]|uniref:DUF418 domain-containing protein n=1 Tax=Massilia phyllostachyos TaxID=2898585 RepID=A0ABS8QA71_9BURK|nr:DUF418 domain-containing protein [Massilia phyllostachyos]MCD2518620.1 DUF418 domain-containing protein [Massilia phyllostachyos]